ncbi:MAG: hypothetical protein ACOZIN_14405 [Myxococcota bacterium]
MKNTGSLTLALSQWERGALVLCLAALVAGCGSCGKKTVAAHAGELSRYLPKDADAVLVVNDLGALGGKIALLQRLKVASFTAQLQGFRDAQEYTSALMSQIGVDLRSAEAMEKAGIDPGRGLGVALLSGDRAYSVLAVKDEGKLEDFLLRLSSMRMGAGVTNTKTDQGVTVTWFSRITGASPALGYVMKNGHAFIAAGASVPLLPSLVALPEEKSLAQEPALKAALARLPQERDLYVHVPAASSRAKGGGAAGATVSAHLAAKALTLVADLPWTGPQEALALAKKQEGPELFGALPPDAFLLGRFSGDPALLAPYWASLVGPHLTKAFTEAGFDFKGEVLDNLKPGAAFALSLSPGINLGGGVPELDVRRTNPFRYVHLSAVAEAKDGAKASQTLAKIPPLAPRFGARIEAVERAGKKLYSTTYSQGEGVHFAQAGNRVLFGAPMARLEELLARAGGTSAPTGGPVADAALRGVLDAHAGAMVLDLRRLAQSVQELPSQAWGIGGFAIKATTLRWLAATDDLRAVTLALDAKENALQAEIRLALTEPPEGRGEGRE